MRRKYLLLLAIFAAPTVVSAQDSRATILYAHDSKIIDSKTGAVTTLLQAQPLKASDCPEGAYYQASLNVVVNCNSGKKYELVAPTGVGHDFLPANAKVLKPLGPRDTDDPGPSLKR
jgi:hypothetical protein